MKLWPVNKERAERLFPSDAYGEHRVKGSRVYRVFSSKGKVGWLVKFYQPSYGRGCGGGGSFWQFMEDDFDSGFQVQRDTKKELVEYLGRVYV